MIEQTSELSLATMLERIREAPTSTASAQAILALQRDLLNATASRLVTSTGDSADVPLARCAIAERRPVVERRGDHVVIAVPLGSIDDDTLVAVHELARPTALTLALAEERLVLTSALVAGRGDWQPVASLVEGLARSSGGHGLYRAAAAIAVATGASRVIAATLYHGVVRSIGDSDDAVTSAEHVARLKLVAGEAFDLASINETTPLPPGLRAFAVGHRVTARTAIVDGRAAVVIALGASRPHQLAPAAVIVAATRARRPALLPPTLVAAAERLPWPRGWSPERRAMAARSAILAVPLLVLLVPVPTSVDAAATIEPLQQRIVTAPFDGRIDTVTVQPGDTVQGGKSVLLRLDARTAESERAEIIASLQGALAQAEAAQVDGRSDDERVARLHATQFAARAEGLALQIAAATIVAPIDGTVAGDDLRKRAGGPVSRGEPLLTVAAPGHYRAEIRVSDREIGGVMPGQAVAIALKARPLDRAHGTVTRLYPIAEVEDGDNIFRVIATLSPGTRGLLPGMSGRAAIRTGWAPLGWLVLRAPVRWVRLKLWI